MPCYSPKKAWKVWNDAEQKWHVIFKDDLKTTDEYKKSLGWLPLAIPCNKCLGCRSEQAKQWAIRCQLEDQESPLQSYFITLTYDDENLPLVGGDDDDIDCFLPTLNKRDVQLFFKRLRKKISFRYFGCGEYGSKTSRPHYHIILFNVGPINDLKFYQNSNGNTLYTSKMLTDTWQKGNVLVGLYSYAAAAYTAKYIQKSFMEDWSELDPRTPPYRMMSRNPGIGRDYLDSHPEQILNDKIYFLRDDKVVAARPPKYSDYILNNCNRELALDIKDQRYSVSSDPLELFTDDGQRYLTQQAESAFRHLNKRDSI